MEVCIHTTTLQEVLGPVHLFIQHYRRCWGLYTSSYNTTGSAGPLHLFIQHYRKCWGLYTSSYNTTGGAGASTPLHTTLQEVLGLYTCSYNTTGSAGASTPLHTTLQEVQGPLLLFIQPRTIHILPLHCTRGAHASHTHLFILLTTLSTNPFWQVMNTSMLKRN